MLAPALDRGRVPMNKDEPPLSRRIASLQSPPTPSAFAIPTLRTRRLTLRAFRAGDFAAYAAMLGDRAVARFIGSGRTRDEAESWETMARALGQWALRGYGLFALEFDGVCIGHAGLRHPSSWPEPELCYAVAPAVQGRGLATEAAMAVRAWAGAALGVVAPISFVRPDNAAAIALARRLGASREADRDLMGATTQVWRHAPPQAGPPASEASSVIDVPLLETPRLRLRRFVLDDFPSICAIHADAETMRYLGDGKPRDAALTWAQMTMWTGAFALGAGGYWAITDAEDARLLGRCGVNAWPAWPEPELAFTLARTNWGKGYASEAAAVVRDWAWRTLVPASLVSFVKVGNAASGRVAAKLGARMTGVITFEGKPTQRWAYPRDVSLAGSG
jgi:RimJ/RimL family protein N-acetyltransferase